MDRIIIGESAAFQYVVERLDGIEQKINGIVDRTITVEQADKLIAALHDVKDKMGKIGQ